MQKLRWGIMATGRIARKFAKGVRESQTGVLQAVGSRSLDSATAFTDEFGGTPLGTYQQLAEHPEVDAIYIATPHHTHEQDTILCAQNKKHVLCEKPFTLNLESTQRALKAVQENDVFFAEAFMYRFAPQTKHVIDLVRNGAIGEVHHIRGEFSYNSGRNSQNFRFERELGGGGLMDVGVYPVSYSRLIFNLEPVRCEYAFEPAERGYDAVGTGFMVFEGGKTASFSTGVHQTMKNDVTIYGETGRITIQNPWWCNGTITIYSEETQATKTVDPFVMADLYSYEVDGVYANLSSKECPEMSIADTLGQARAIDMLKLSSGLTFD